MSVDEGKAADGIEVVLLLISLFCSGVRNDTDCETPKDYYEKGSITERTNEHRLRLLELPPYQGGRHCAMMVLLLSVMHSISIQSCPKLFYLPSHIITNYPRSSLSLSIS